MLRPSNESRVNLECVSHETRGAGREQWWGRRDLSSLFSSNSWSFTRADSGNAEKGIRISQPKAAQAEQAVNVGSGAQAQQELNRSGIDASRAPVGPADGGGPIMVACGAADTWTACGPLAN